MMNHNSYQNITARLQGKKYLERDLVYINLDRDPEVTPVYTVIHC